MRLDAAAMAVIAVVLQKVIHFPANAAEVLDSRVVFRLEVWTMKTFADLDARPASGDGRFVFESFLAVTSRVPQFADLFARILLATIESATSTFVRFAEVASGSALNIVGDSGFASRFVAALASQFAPSTLSEQLGAFKTAQIAWKQLGSEQYSIAWSRTDQLYDALKKSDIIKASAATFSANTSPKFPEVVTEATVTGTSPVRRARVPEAAADTNAATTTLLRRPNTIINALSSVTSAQTSVVMTCFGDAAGAIDAAEGALAHAHQAHHPDVLALAHVSRALALLAAGHVSDAAEDLSICLHICHQNRALTQPPISAAARVLLRAEAMSMLTIAELLAGRCGCLTDGIMLRLNHGICIGCENLVCRSSKSPHHETKGNPQQRKLSNGLDIVNTFSDGSTASSLVHYIDGALMAARVCIALIHGANEVDDAIFELAVVTTATTWRRAHFPSLSGRNSLRHTSQESVALSTAKLSLITRSALGLAWNERNGVIEARNAVSKALSAFGSTALRCEVIIAEAFLLIFEALRLLDVGFARCAFDLAARARQLCLTKGCPMNSAEPGTFLASKIICQALLCMGEPQRIESHCCNFLDSMGFSASQWTDENAESQLGEREREEQRLLPPDGGPLLCQLFRASAHCAGGRFWEAVQIADAAAEQAEPLSTDIMYECKLIGLRAAVKLRNGADYIKRRIDAIDPTKLSYRTGCEFISLLFSLAALGYGDLIPSSFVADLGSKCAQALRDLILATTCVAPSADSFPKIPLSVLRSLAFARSRAAADDSVAAMLGEMEETSQNKSSLQHCVVMLLSDCVVTLEEVAELKAVSVQRCFSSVAA